MKNKNLFAYALIIIGGVLVLQNFNIPIFESLNIGSLIGLIWPFFIIMPGIGMLKGRSSFMGIFLVVLGGAFLLDNALEIIGINFQAMSIFKFFWPALLVYAGIKIIYSPTKSKHSKNHSHREYDESYDDESSSYQERFEANTEKPSSIAFNAKKYTYTKDTMKSGISTINLNITFGGAEIIVEEGIQVILIGQYTMGGHEFFNNDEGGFHSDIKEVRYPEETSDFYDQTLVIKANITFGGLEVYSM